MSNKIRLEQMLVAMEAADDALHKFQDEWEDTEEELGDSIVKDSEIDIRNIKDDLIKMRNVLQGKLEIELAKGQIATTTLKGIEDL